MSADPASWNLETAAEIHQRKAAAAPLQPKQYRHFPTAMLPAPLARFVGETAAALGCEPAYIAMPALAACASAIGTTRAVSLKESWHEPAIVWGCIIARSGTLKSPAMEKALEPLIESQAEGVLRHHAALAEHDAAKLRWEIERTEWRKRGGQGEPPPEPAVPVMRRHLVGDTTIEALAPILQGNPRGVLLGRDELAGWLRGFNQYKGGTGGDAQAWLELWRAGALVVDRKSGVPIIVRRAGVSVFGTIQPGMFAASMRGEGFESGLAARLLLAAPPQERKRWSNRTPSAAAVNAYAETIRALLDLQSVDTAHGADPLLLPLSVEALATWEAFYNRHADRQRLAASDHLAAALAKIEAYAARLALIAELVTDPTSLRIGANAMQRGVALADWFAYEVERVYETFSQTEGERKRDCLIEWIGRRGGTVTVRDLTHGLRQFRGDEDGAATALAGLVKGGIGQWQIPSGRGRPTMRFSLVTGVTVTNTTEILDETAIIGDGDTVENSNGDGREVVET